MEFSKHSSQLFSILSLYLLTNVAFSNPSFSSNAIAGGSYLTTAGTNRPLLTTTNNGGGTWVYPSNILSTLPADIGTDSAFAGASCSGFNCLASGFYQTNSSPSTIKPLLAVSHDGGILWKYPVTIASALPSNFQNGKFTSSPRCSGLNCIAAGNYVANSIGQLPLLASTHDAGKTWNYPSTILSELPSDFLGTGSFRAVTSWKNTFIAVGQYETNTHQLLPLVSQSGDEGITWAYPSSIFANLPSDFNGGGIFNSTSCDVSTCAAAGVYTATNSNNYPLIAIDMGHNAMWSYSSISNLPTAFLSVTAVNKISCSKNYCIVAGQYQSTNASIKYPLLVSSQNNGNNWEYPSTIISNLPADFQDYGYFNGAHCNRHICIAVGQYHSSTKGWIPLLANSLDGGATWTYPASIATNLPTNTVSGMLNGVHCNAADCTAEGQILVTGGTYYPLIATSHDAGVTWTYPSSVVTNLPADYANNGILNGGYSSFTLKRVFKKLFQG